MNRPRRAKAVPSPGANIYNHLEIPKRNIGPSREQQIAAIKQQLERLPTLIANLGVNFVKDNFDTESWEGRKWRPRQTGAPRNAYSPFRCVPALSILPDFSSSCFHSHSNESKSLGNHLPFLY